MTTTNSLRVSDLRPGDTLRVMTGAGYEYSYEVSEVVIKRGGAWIRRTKSGLATEITFRNYENEDVLERGSKILGLISVTQQAYVISKGVDHLYLNEEWVF